MSLKLVEVQIHFQQWGLDFIVEISTKSSIGYSWILVVTNYFTKWVEVIPTRTTTSKVVNKFLLNNIITRFGCPKNIVTDNFMCFSSEEFIKFCDKYGINRSTYSPYHPQGNGQAESSKKSLLKIIKRILEEIKKAWDSKLPLTLWVDRVTMNKAIKCAPFDPIYVMKDRLLQNNLRGMYKFSQHLNDDLIDEMHIRMDEIMQLDETRRDASSENAKL